ncbi:MAG: sugar phosphate isomerase/epimerase [Tannerella sp.]|jgi:sugar phosphate isomerase/epimerase|nr:sugar phosphate isomerase/epimerase [Tannerella sp.]
MNLSNFQTSSRRTFLRNMTLLGMALPFPFTSCTAATGKDKKSVTEKKRPFRISINVSTISGFKLPVTEQIKLAAAGGFEGIELWMSDINRHIKEGGTAGDLEKLLQDSGMRLENIIAFSSWLSNDVQTGIRGIEQMKADMDLTAQLGGHHIAATADGLDTFLMDNLEMYGNQFAEIIRMGKSYRVTPLLELWGHGTLNKLWKALSIAAESREPDTQLLLDFFHLFAGGNSFDALSLINGACLPVFHINDYPGDIPAAIIRDADRVYPGDGVCPFDEVIPMLYQAGFRGAFSLEIFNASYWSHSTPQQVLATGFRKTTEVIDKALATLDG